jgi:hypothetical protein
MGRAGLRKDRLYLGETVKRLGKGNAVREYREREKEAVLYPLK